MNNSLSLKVKFALEDENTQEELMKVKIWIGTYGLNRNHSNIDKEAYERAIPTLYNKPIVGKYDIDEEDFREHDCKLVLKDDGETVEVVDTTVPYGVIPESCNARWETDEDGVEYLVCDGYLWNGRYPVCEKIKDNTCNQSMEINLINYEVKDKVTYIHEFSFTGLCILGENFEPCFSSAKLVYSLNKEEYKKQFNLLLNKVNKIDSNNKGGIERMNEREKLIAKFSYLKDNEEYKKIIENKELQLEDLKTQLFSLSVKDLKRRLNETIETQTFIKTWSWGETEQIEKYSIVDILTEENIVICEDNEKHNVFYGFNYTIEGDKVTVDFINGKRYVRGDWREYVEGVTVEPEPNPTVAKEKETVQNKINELSSSVQNVTKENKDLTDELTTIKTNYALLEQENSKLKTFKNEVEENKKKSEIDSIIAKYSKVKEIDGFDVIYNKRYELSKEDLQDKLAIFCFNNGVSLKDLKEDKSKTETVQAKFAFIDKSDKNTSTQDSRWSFLDKLKEE